MRRLKVDILRDCPLFSPKQKPAGVLNSPAKETENV
jgi:hypothetical protein